MSAGHKIQLFQFYPIWGLPNPSPFCVKVETYLRLAGLPYECRIGNPFKAPKRKLPTINDNGRIIADSSLIIEYLKTTYGDPLDADLTALQKTTGYAFQKLFEEYLYWIGIYLRWQTSAGWAICRDGFFVGVKGIRGVMLPYLLRSTLKKRLHGQGLGMHSATEICEFGKEGISSIAAFLDDKPFFLGQKPTSYDAVAYAFLCNLLWDPIPSPVKDHAFGFKNLTRYAERMKSVFEKGIPQSAR